MTLIDRERCRQRNRRFAESRKKTLQRMAYRLYIIIIENARTQVVPTYSEVLAFLLGYFSENDLARSDRDTEMMLISHHLGEKTDRNKKSSEAIALLRNSLPQLFPD